LQKDRLYEERNQLAAQQFQTPVIELPGRRGAGTGSHGMPAIPF
jgi:hypothetical protein